MLNQNENYIFDSAFECGNLDVVNKKGPNEFDLFLRSDSNTRRSHQWFYFSITNKIIGKIKINIQNLTRPNSFFQKGMRICLFSKRKFEDHEILNFRGGENIEYKNSFLSPLYHKYFGVESNYAEKIIFAFHLNIILTKKMIRCIFHFLNHILTLIYVIF